MSQSLPSVEREALKRFPDTGGNNWIIDAANRKQREIFTAGAKYQRDLDTIRENEVNVKMLQSEIGAVGEASPNLQVVKDIMEEVQYFSHEHGTITNNDCALVIATCRLGRKVYTDAETAYSYDVFRIGCHDDLVQTLVAVFEDNPDLLLIAAEAVARSMDR